MLEKADLAAAPNQAEHKKPPKAPRAEGSEGLEAAKPATQTLPQAAQGKKGEISSSKSVIMMSTTV